MSLDATPFEIGWYIASTFTKKEFIAEKDIKNNGLEAYAPRSS